MKNRQTFDAKMSVAQCQLLTINAATKAGRDGVSEEHLVKIADWFDRVLLQNLIIDSVFAGELFVSWSDEEGDIVLHHRNNVENATSYDDYAKKQKLNLEK